MWKKGWLFFSVLVVMGLIFSPVYSMLDHLRNFKLLESSQTQNVRSPVIVTLGYGLTAEGEPRPKLVERLNAALEIARHHQEALVLVTGGAAKAGVTESEAMSRWLIARGLEENRILQESQSRHTVDNALNSSRIIDELAKSRDIDSVILVSSASHYPRAAILFELALESFQSQDLPVLPVAHDASQGPEALNWALFRDTFHIYLAKIL